MPNDNPLAQVVDVAEKPRRCAGGRPGVRIGRAGFEV